MAPRPTFTLQWGRVLMNAETSVTNCLTNADEIVGWRTSVLNLVNGHSCRSSGELTRDSHELAVDMLPVTIEIEAADENNVTTDSVLKVSVYIRASVE